MMTNNCMHIMNVAVNHRERGRQLREVKLKKTWPRQIWCKSTQQERSCTELHAAVDRGTDPVWPNTSA